MYNPRVYVGTYGKYNAGSLKGGWVKLNDCKDYQAFLRNCRALHRWEHDPEYMIQDSEDFPDGLDCMEWLSEQDFNDVKAACREAVNEQCEHETLSPAEMLRAALLAIQPGKAKQREADTPAMYKAWLEEYISTSPKWADYYRKEYVGAVKMHDCFYPIKKQRIKNQFCFYDEGPQYDLYQKLMADENRLAAYFKKENLREFDELIERLENGTKFGRHERGRWSVEDNRLYLYFADGYNSKGFESYTPCTDDERSRLLTAIKWGRELLEKRLDAYLKRYGTSKLHTWTYWADA